MVQEGQPFRGIAADTALQCLCFLEVQRDAFQTGLLVAEPSGLGFFPARSPLSIGDTSGSSVSPTPSRRRRTAARP